MQLRNPSGNVIYGPFSSPPIVDEPGVGNYSYSWTTLAGEALGQWTAEWSGVVSGLPVQGNDYVEVVLAGSIAFGPLEFLIKPDDYDAIRNVLGLEASQIDITDEDIERLLFAPQAEQRIKNRITNWAEQRTDPDRLFVLRMAAAYATAALMAESLAKGGTIGRVYPNTSRETFTGLSEILWQRHLEWLAMAEAYDMPAGDMYTIGLLRASGPTKRGLVQLDLDTPPPWTWGWNTTWGGWSR